MTERAFQPSIFTLRDEVISSARLQTKKSTLKVGAEKDSAVLVGMHNSRIHIALILENTVTLHISFDPLDTTNLYFHNEYKKIDELTEEATRQAFAGVINNSGRLIIENNELENMRESFTTILEILSIF